MMQPARASREPSKRIARDSTRPFLWENGEAVDLNDRLAPGEDWTIHTANDINQAGVIVGTGSPSGGASRAIALVPFPGNLPLADARTDILKWIDGCNEHETCDIPGRAR